ncbi:MAG: hypothetical protein O2860_12720, partial [Chloroflexi bacterium]|nr:hypothetical protein [Chloroflexota bacterium]
MAETYDIVLSSPFSNYGFFGHKMREYCGQMGLSFFLVNDVWVKEFTQKLRDREIRVKVLLDLTANQTIEDDPYLMLAREVKRQRGTVIDDPDVTVTAAHKGKFHQTLLENHIPVPETVVVERGGLDTFKITDEISRDSPDQPDFPGYSSLWDTANYNPRFQGRQMRPDSLK